MSELNKKKTEQEKEEDHSERSGDAIKPNSVSSAHASNSAVESLKNIQNYTKIQPVIEMPEEKKEPEKEPPRAADKYMRLSKPFAEEKPSPVVNKPKYARCNEQFLYDSLIPSIYSKSGLLKKYDMVNSWADRVLKDKFPKNGNLSDDYDESESYDSDESGDSYYRY